jgi:hypothetical protein
MAQVEGRRPALIALLGFLGLTFAAIMVGGSRPGLQQGVAPTVLQFSGYACALAGAVLLLRAGARGTGAAVLGALVVLVGLDVALGELAGVNIGGGLVRVLCLGVIVAVTLRLMSPPTEAGRR